MATARPPGLRERKKQQTRAALSMAALRLAVERGLDNVKVEDIAGAAGVSPRTFNNYFSSKSEAIASRHVDRIAQIAADLRDRPVDEPLWESLVRVTVAQFGGADGAEGTVPDASWTTGVRLMTTEPAFVGEYLRAAALGERTIAVAVAERTGTDPDTDLHPRLVAAAVTTAIRIASDRWSHADPPVPLGPLLRSALEQIAAGLPAPSTGDQASRRSLSPTRPSRAWSAVPSSSPAGVRRDR